MSSGNQKCEFCKNHRIKPAKRKHRFENVLNFKPAVATHMILLNEGSEWETQLPICAYCKMDGLYALGGISSYINGYTKLI